MISTFDLTLLGSLVSAGGLLFLRQGKWPHVGLGRPPESQRQIELSVECRETQLAGARWLTVGLLTLFIGYVHGADAGYYLFGPWSDVLFHVVFVSTCWATSAFRIRQTAGQAATVIPATHSTPRISP